MVPSGAVRSLTAVSLLALALPGCASLPTTRTLTPSFALADTATTALGRGAAETMREIGGPTGIHLLPRGPGAFLARLALVNSAERSLDLQYYLWNADKVGTLLYAALFRAADRGVRVRLLIDDIGSLADDETLLQINAHPNIEVRLFNPAAMRSARSLWVLTEFSRVNRRMHNKAIVADNQAAILGGRNIGDEYFEARSDFNYADIDAIAVGAAVADVSARFDRYWNSPLVYGIAELHAHRPTPADVARMLDGLQEYERQQHGQEYEQAMLDSPLAREMRAGKVVFAPARVRVTADDPIKVERPGADPAQNLLPQLLPELDAAREHVVLVSPYFVPSDGWMQRLGDLRARGVRVRVLTNGLASTDELPVFGKYRKYRRRLVEAGVELYEVNVAGARQATGAGGVLQVNYRALPDGALPPRAALHGKMLVFDCREFFVGSMNLDPRSARTNTEVGFVIDAPAIAGPLCDGLDQTLSSAALRVELGRAPGGARRLEWVGVDGGRDVRLTREPHGTRWLRFKAWLFGILPIKSLV